MQDYFGRKYLQSGNIIPHRFEQHTNPSEVVIDFDSIVLKRTIQIYNNI